jgi:hypothetical protein
MTLKKGLSYLDRVDTWLTLTVDAALVVIYLRV